MEPEDEVIETKELDVSSEIDAMLSSLGNESLVEKSDDKPPEESKDEKPPDATPPEEPPDKEPEEATSDKEPPEPEPPPAPDADDKDKIISDLRAKLAEKETPKEPEKPKEPEPPKFDEQDFVGDIDFDTLSDPKELNKLLNKTYQKAVVDVSTQFTQNLPGVVREQITTIQNLQKASEQFYKDNPDLAGFKKVVGTVFGELVEVNPDKTYSDLMAETGKEVRKRLNLSEPKKEETTSDKKPDLKLVDKGKPPKLPKSGSKAGQIPETKPSDLSSEIDTMNKVLER